MTEQFFTLISIQDEQSDDDGVFKYYRGDPMLTARTKVSSPDISTANPLYVRTGDLCRYNNDGDIVYVGREDFRVKIYGQLVEPETIEQIVMKASDLVNSCVVRKEEVKDLNDEYLSCHLLVTSAVDSRDLIHRIEVYCRQNLPSFMVPVAWQVHCEFPLTPTGKIDRKQLGEIKRRDNVGNIRNELENETNRNLTTNDEPATDWEKRVHAIWHEVLSITDPTTISVTAHLFSLGGNSFQFMSILAAYRNHFDFSTNFPSLISFLEHTTIRGHARILEQALTDITVIENKLTLQALHVIEGPLHPGQAWIVWLDKQMFATQPSAQSTQTNVSLPLIVEHGSVSIKRLREALRRVIVKHAILHTSFHFDTHTNKWFQRIEQLANDNEGFTFVLTEGVESYGEINRLVLEEYSIRGLFDMERGQLIRLHIVRRGKTPPINEDLLQVGDIIIFTVRHEAIDGSSTQIFLSDLVQSYDTGELVVDPNAISYLDYTIYQSRVDRSASIAYWIKYFDEINLAVSRVNSRIPSDRPWLLNPYKITLSIPIPFRLDDKIASAMVECARENNVTIANLCLACHFAFLIELTGEWDLAVDCNAAKRPLEPEAANILGPFVDYIKCRVSLDKKTNPTFQTLLEKTHNVMMQTLDHLFAEEDPLSIDLTEMLDTNPQCSDFQFDETLEDVILDKDVRLQYLLNPSDSMPAAIWWRVATDSHFGAYVIYNSRIVELSYAFVFSTATYEQPTANRYVAQFKAMLERIFGEKTRPIDHQTEPLSSWLKQATTTSN